MSQTGARQGDVGARRVAALLAAVLLSVTALPLLAAPAAAIGPTVDISITPPRAVGTPTKDGAGPANLTAMANVFGTSSSAGQLVFTVTNNMGWQAQPASHTESVPAGGGQYQFDFQIMVPPEAESGITAGVEVRAEYRVGPATLASGNAGASVEAGKFYGATVRRITAPEPMSPGRTYVVEFDVVNTGNAGSVMEFSWPDRDLISRLKADFVAPTTLPLGGQENATAAFRITPQGTTPAGSYSVPVQMTITDRTGQDYEFVNFTIELEFDNLPIYPGLLPRFDLHGLTTVLTWLAVFFVLWLLGNAGVALGRRKDYDARDGNVFLQAYTERLSNTLLYRGARRAVRRRVRARAVEEA